MGSPQAAQAVECHDADTTAEHNTFSAILRRRNLLGAGAPAGDGSLHRRLKYAAPNELWQMDYKGHFTLRHGRCHPLTVLDNRSRFAVGLSALPMSAKSLRASG